MSEQKVPGGEKFLPVFFVDEVKVGEQFRGGNWPLHITLFPPIAEPYDERAAARMRLEVNPVSPFFVTAGEEDMFGPERTIPVRKIEHSESLSRVHKGLVRALSMLVHDPQYRLPYNPHISLAKEGILPAQGEQLWVEGLSVAEQRVSTDASGETRKVWEVVDKMRFKGIDKSEYESAGEYE